MRTAPTFYNYVCNIAVQKERTPGENRLIRFVKRRCPGSTPAMFRLVETHGNKYLELALRSCYHKYYYFCYSRGLKPQGMKGDKV